MLTPDYRGFLQLSRNATLIPVAKTLSADLLTPVGAFLSIAARQKYAFLLESVEGGEKIGRYTFLGAQPRTVITARGKELTIRDGSSVRRHQGSVIELLREHLRQHRPRSCRDCRHLPPAASDTSPMTWCGSSSACPSALRTTSACPIVSSLFTTACWPSIICATRFTSSPPPTCARSRRARPTIARSPTSPRSKHKLAKGVRGHAFTGPTAASRRPIKVHNSTSHEEFVQSVRRAKEYIAAGDVFQVVLSQRLDFKPPAEPFQIYRALRTVNPSPYMFFLKLDDIAGLGASPEMLVRVSGRKLEYRPIAGTHKRGADAAEDEQLIEQLRNDEKERAEHVMLVDLGRNDLGRVSEYGSVKVRDLMYVEKYSHVMHLVSALEGQLRGDLDALDALAACFPAGTLSGAPKVRAMEIIEELEPVRRGVYGGSVLYADHAGNLDSCIAIRTMVLHGNRAYVQAGAGIVADSDPESEYQECMNKASALCCERRRRREAEERFGSFMNAL